MLKEFLEKWSEEYTYVKKIQFSLLAFLAIGNIYIYSFGYRLTADEIAFHLYSMGPFESVLSYAHNLAISQGRIGQHIISLLNIYSSSASSYLFFRLIFASIYFLSYIVFFYYLSKRLRCSITIPLTLTLFAISPVMFHHMAPNAYPLQNTLPFFVMTVIRIINFDRKISNPFFIVLYFIAMLTSEYALLFSISIILIDYYFSIVIKPENVFMKKILERMIYDIVLLLLAVCLYILFRILNPSEYEGNQIAAFSTLRVGYVTLMHIWNGTSLSQLNLSTDHFVLSWTLFGCLLGILATSIAFVDKSSMISAKSCIVVVPIMIFCSIFVVAPVAYTPKMQSWCIESGDCAFLSSRSALYFIVPVVYCVLRYASLERRIWCLILFCLTSATAISNIRVAHEMLTYVEPFEKVERLACSIKWQDIDPSNSVVMHPNFDRGHYWETYLSNTQATKGCSIIAPAVAR